MKLLNRFKISSPIQRGAIRAAIAAAIAIIIARIFTFSHAYWILMTTIILVQANLGATISKSKQRIFGTILGVLIGIMASIVIKQHIIAMLTILIILAFLMFYTVVFSYALSIFFGAMFVIMVLSITLHQDPWIFVYSRIIDTLIGATIALFVSFCFWPNWARQDFNDALINGIDSCHTFFLDIIQMILNKTQSPNNLKGKAISTEELLAKTKQRLDDYKHEPGAMFMHEGAVNAILYAQERIHNILLSLQTIAQSDTRYHFSKKFTDEVFELIHMITQINDQLKNSIKTRSALPDFSELDKNIYQLRKTAKKSTSGEGALLFRNIFSYAFELKHIAESIKQIRS